jgi:hypothetical protein
VGCDERIHLANRFAGVGKSSGNDAKPPSRGSIKRQRLDARKKSVDCTVNLPRRSLVRTEAKLGDGDRADAELGAFLQRESGADCPDSAKRKADGVGIEHEERHELN